MTNATAPNAEMLGVNRRSSVENVATVKEAQDEGLLVKGKERLKKYEQRFEDYVAEHPVKSVLIAAGAGLAIGWLVTRKR
jgi:ElaB/YqjD/DUF883 family membrane-anchored ribosome-binding protein